VRVTILGGGGFRVPLICRELAASGLAIGEVVLYDVVPERLGVISAVLAADGLLLRTTTDLDTALRGADVILAALRVGGLDGRVADERSALDAGVIGQETVGAGGLSYAARAVPVVDTIARRVAELAPEAWVISMTNPAGIVTEVMAATLGPRVIGGTGTVLVEVPLHASLGDLDTVRRELDGEAGVRVPEETRAEIVSVTLDDPSEIEAVLGLRASMELVAPHVALSIRVGPFLAAALDEPAWTRLFAAAHRVHVVVPGPVDAASRAHLDRLLRHATSPRTALLVEAGSRRGSAKDSLELALETARRAQGTGARVLVTLDPALDLAPLFAYRKLAADLAAASLSIPLVLLDRPALRGADDVLGPAAALGGLLCQGLGDAIHVEAGTAGDSRRLGFNILQAARVRMTKTEFISCPSCGRTLFDLETTTAAIKSKTAHLKGLKIAVMGCVVNGPGEMADADFGYVGWGDSKIALFVGKEMVEKDIPAEGAADRLVALIRKNGKWIDP
jgi:hypothetical protein